MPQTTEETRKLLEPVRFISGDDESKQPRPGVALCLSGGGYRAMVFHLGTLIRLNELGQLRKLARVSSVSGGSITAGVLGLNWKKLKFNANDQAENLMDMVIRPLMDFAGERPQRDLWLERQGRDGVVDYVRAKNAVSIDGLPALDAR